MTKDLLRAAMVQSHGPGGLNCPCCGPAPSVRKTDKRRLKRGQVRRALDKLISESLEAGE